MASGRWSKREGTPMLDLLRTIARVTQALDALATDLERPEPATK